MGQTVRLIGAILLFGGAQIVHAQAPFRVLAGFPPGGAVDVVARVVAERIGEATKRPALVENRVGASGRLSIMAVKNAPADGTMMVVIPDSALTLFPHTVDQPPFGIDDFVPVAHVGNFETGLAVGASAPGDLKSWVAWVKADRKNAIYGSPSAGSNQHFVGYVLGEAIGVPLEHGSYNGVGPTINGVLGGHVPSVVLPMAQLLPLAKAGKLRILAHSGAQRSASGPEIPTFKEQGYPSLALSGWYLIVMHAATKPELVAQLNGVINQSLRSASVQERLRTQDLELQEMAPQEIGARLRTEFERWRPVVRASGFKTNTGL